MSRAAELSESVAGFLRAQRKARGFGLRQVQQLSAQYGNPIPFATLAKIELGSVEPGLLRVATLFRLYEVPIDLLDDLLQLETAVRGPAAPAFAEPEAYRQQAVEIYRKGETNEAIRRLLLLRNQLPVTPETAAVRAKTDQSFANIVAILGRRRLARYLFRQSLLSHRRPADLAYPLACLAVQENALSRTETALAWCHAAARALRRTPNASTAATAEKERLTVLARSGKSDEAFRGIVAVQQAYRANHDIHGLVGALQREIRWLVELQRLEEASQRLDQLEREAQAAGYSRSAGAILMYRGQIAVLRGQFDRALEIANQLEQEEAATRNELSHVVEHYLRWKVAEGRGDRPTARAELLRARSFAVRIQTIAAVCREVITAAKGLEAQESAIASARRRKAQRSRTPRQKD